MTTPTPTNWEEEFHKQYCDYVTGSPGSYAWKKYAFPVNIEIFISKLRTEAYAEAVNDIVEKICTMGKDFVKNDSEYGTGITFGYNKALSEVIKALREQSK